jgi:DNA-directed RNA polymerase specialized sigma24 family protein
MDLIEDFLLEEWDGIAQRYDASKGTAGSYIAGAFVHYAQRRIARMRRWSGALRDSALLANSASTEGREETYSVGDRDIVARVVSSLPAELKAALEAYLSASGRQEREIAKGLNITRHRLRTDVADAFGRVAVAIGATQELSSDDQEIARLLWRDGLTVARVARHLNISAVEVQKVRMRVLDRLRKALS